MAGAAGPTGTPKRRRESGANQGGTAKKRRDQSPHKVVTGKKLSLTDTQVSTAWSSILQYMRVKYEFLFRGDIGVIRCWLGVLGYASTTMNTAPDPGL